MYIEAVPNRDSPPAILLRESYREAGKVKKRTLLNLSDWPHERIAGFKALLKGGTVIPKDQDATTIISALPHGHVESVLGTARKIGLDRLLGPDGNRCRDLILALVVSRIVDPGSKLAAARALSPADRRRNRARSFGGYGSSADQSHTRRIGSSLARSRDPAPPLPVAAASAADRRRQRGDRSDRSRGRRLCRALSRHRPSPDHHSRHRRIERLRHPGRNRPRHEPLSDRRAPDLLGRPVPEKRRERRQAPIDSDAQGGPLAQDHPRAMRRGRRPQEGQLSPGPIPPPARPPRRQKGARRARRLDPDQRLPHADQR